MFGDSTKGARGGQPNPVEKKIIPAEVGDQPFG